MFNSFYVSIVHAGEETGKLKDSLEYLAEYIAGNYELNQKTKKALTYPTFVIITFVVVMIIMTIYVIPKLAELLLSQNRELPLLTQIVLGVSNFMINY